jgi:hypothetical protein
MKKIIYFTALITFMACATHKKEVGNNANPLTGKWNWVNSTGGFAGIQQTPESTGKSRHLLIDDTHIKYYEDQELINNEGYTTGFDKVIEHTEEKEVIYSQNNKMSYTIRNDTLILKEQCYDCFTHVYIRDKK